MRRIFALLSVVGLVGCTAAMTGPPDTPPPIAAPALIDFPLTTVDALPTFDLYADACPSGTLFVYGAYHVDGSTRLLYASVTEQRAFGRFILIHAATRQAWLGRVLRDRQFVASESLSVESLLDRYASPCDYLAPEGEVGT